MSRERKFSEAEILTLKLSRSSGKISGADLEDFMFPKIPSNMYPKMAIISDRIMIRLRPKSTQGVPIDENPTQDLFPKIRNVPGISYLRWYKIPVERN